MEASVADAVKSTHILNKAKVLGINTTYSLLPPYMLYTLPYIQYAAMQQTAFSHYDESGKVNNCTVIAQQLHSLQCSFIHKMFYKNLLL